jgi:hypothetical protein
MELKSSRQRALAIMDAQKEVVDEPVNGKRVKVMAAPSPTKDLEVGKRDQCESVSSVGQNKGEDGDDRKGWKKMRVGTPSTELSEHVVERDCVQGRGEGEG